jgi:DNA-binding NarL/FixJ family response regulator
VIIFSVQLDDEELLGSIKVGAAHYTTKDVPPAELVEIVQQVGQGHYLIDEGILRHPRLAAQVLHQFTELANQAEAEVLYAPLTRREVEVLDLIAQGSSNKQIARHMSISEQTVKNHITSILKKLQVNDRTQAVVYAFKHGWIKVSEDV